MRLVSRVLGSSIAGLALALLSGAYVFAEGSTLIVEQRTPLPSNGTWTLLKPDQTVLKKGGKDHTIELLAAGRYTLFAEGPEGTTATLFIYKGEELLKKIESPQYSFTFAETDALRIVVQYRLTKNGNVTVESAPLGVHFVLRGPNNMREEGVTPLSFKKTAAGQYSVNYHPPGCIEPRPQSQVLRAGERISFTIDIRCDTLDLPAKESMPDDDQYVQTEANGRKIVLRDVPIGSWYAKYVFDVARLGILAGYRDSQGEPTGSFGPENPVTLAELAKIAHEVSGIDETAFRGPAMNVSAHGSWFSQYIASAEVQAWTIYGDRMTVLSRPATRGEVLVTLLQALDVPLTWQKGDLFQDVRPNTSHAAAIETAARAGLVEGKKDAGGTPTPIFSPFDPINRAEMAKILSKAIELYRTEKK